MTKEEGGNDRGGIKAIVITNIFRDQLDRYGEIDKTAAILKKAINNTPESTLILNADDPIVASLERNLDGQIVIDSQGLSTGKIPASAGMTKRGREMTKEGGKDPRTISTRLRNATDGQKCGASRKNTTYFGITDERLEAKSDLAIDIKDCLICGTELVYPHRYYGHIGLYICENCGFVRPKTKVTAKNVRLSLEKTSATINIDKETAELNLPMTGLYNLYNALAAISVANFMKIKSTLVFKTLNNQKPAFGRMESFEIDGKKAVIHLVKNPTGFNQVLEAITQNRKSKTALIVLNDNFADGTDISWIWD